MTNYTRIWEQIVDGVKVNETVSTAAHLPTIRLTAPNFSLVSGAVCLQNKTGTSGGNAIGWTIASGHPGDFTKDYIANEQQQDGYWTQLNVAGLATTSFSSTQRNLGIVSSISVDAYGNQLPSGGNPVYIQIAGEGYVFTSDVTIVLGSFLIPDVNGKVKATPFNPASPTPIIGYARENYSQTYQNMVLMRIQLCGE